MTNPVSFTATEHLRDGRTIEIRALHRDDREDMLAAVGRTSGASLQRRFFGIKRGFSEAETAFFMDIDFEKHVALVALLAPFGAPASVALAAGLVWEGIIIAGGLASGLLAFLLRGK